MQMGSHLNEQTDRQSYRQDKADMTKLTVFFCNCVNAPKNDTSEKCMLLRAATLLDG